MEKTVGEALVLEVMVKAMAAQAVQMVPMVEMAEDIGK